MKWNATPGKRTQHRQTDFCSLKTTKRNLLCLNNSYGISIGIEKFEVEILLLKFEEFVSGDAIPILHSFYYINISENKKIIIVNKPNMVKFVNYWNK